MIRSRPSLRWREASNILFGKVISPISVLVVLSFCHPRIVMFNSSAEKLSYVRAIVMLPLHTNFNLREIQRYRFFQTSKEVMSQRGRYFVIDNTDYRTNKDCNLNEIFICSDLRKILSDANIGPDSVLFLRASLFEERNVVQNTIQGVDSLEKGNLYSGLKYRYILTGLFYNGELPIFEERYEFEPDLNSNDVFRPLMVRNKEILVKIIAGLNSYTGLGRPQSDTKWFPNYNSAFYKSESDNGVCRTGSVDINREIEADIFFEMYYPDLEAVYRERMKDYSCGILFLESNESFLADCGLKRGDIIISFCGRRVYGMYSIRNAIVAGDCKYHSNKIVLIRNGEGIELIGGYLK